MIFLHKHPRFNILRKSSVVGETTEKQKNVKVSKHRSIEPDFD